MTSRKDGLVVRLGQTFSLGEVLHFIRCMEAMDCGNRELAMKLMRDPLAGNVRRKFMSMRNSGRKKLAEASQPIAVELTGKEASDAV